MVAYTPISPRLASDIVDQAQIDAAWDALASFAEAGIVKAYARLAETVHTDGRREEVRDKRITRELWRRIVAEGRAQDIASGTVRLQGSAEFGGGPKVTLIGIGFDDASVRAFASRHGTPLPVPQVAPQPTPFTPVADASAPPAAPAVAAAKPRSSRPVPTAAPGAQAVTIDQACAMLNVGRTTIYELNKQGKLTITKIGRRSVIAIEEINRLLGKGND